MDLDNKIKCVAEINVADYLTKEEMHDIAAKTFQKRIEVVIDNLQEGRDKRLSDLVLDRAVDRYVANLPMKFEENLLKMINDIIDTDDMHTEDGEVDYGSFRYSVKSSLGRVCEGYIDEHKTEMLNMMIDQIKGAVKLLSAERIAAIISYKFNFRDVVKSLVKSLDEDENTPDGFDNVDRHKTK